MQRPLYRKGPLELRFWVKVLKTETCWLWIGAVDHKGYGKIKDSGAKGRFLIASRVSWMLHFGPIPDGMFACHHCDTPPCVRPDHLFLGTRLDNNADMHRKGRGLTGRPSTHDQHGERHPSARLTNAQVLAIRAECVSPSRMFKDIAKEYGISVGHLRSIRVRKTWSHLPSP